MEFDPMPVQVRIQVSTQPNEEDLEGLRDAAKELTDNSGSITVKIENNEENYDLVADFTMRRSAQYKVVGDIGHIFKLRTWNLENY